MKEPKANPYLKATIQKVLENQLRGNNPPETRQTFERLLREGYSKKEAERLISCVVAAEISYVAKGNEPFNHARFVKALNNLPELPGEEE